MRRFAPLALFAAAAGCTGLGAESAADRACQPASEAPAPESAAPAGPAATVFYLNRAGATLTAGYDDAARGASSVVASRGLARAEIPAAPLDDAAWSGVVSCVRDQFARFNVRVTDERPEGAHYLMAVFGGTGAELGYGESARGAAPLDAQGCRAVEDAVVFVFSGKLGADAQAHCEVAAQEIAHAFSVDHEYLAADPMSYLPFSGKRAFQDIDAPCGEDAPRACICGRPSQSSVRILTDRLGPAPAADATPPTVTADLSPSKRGSVAVTVRATDEGGIATVALTFRDANTFIATTCGDGQLPCTAAAGTWTFLVPGAHGTATFNATAVDRAGNAATTLAREVALDAALPDATPIALTVDTATADGVVTPTATISTSAGAIASATLYWTDARGLSLSRPLCPTGDGRFSLPVHLDRRAGARSFVVVATDTEGHTAVSPLTTLMVE